MKASRLVIRTLNWGNHKLRNVLEKGSVIVLNLFLLVFLHISNSNEIKLQHHKKMLFQKFPNS